MKEKVKSLEEICNKMTEIDTLNEELFEGVNELSRNNKKLVKHIVELKEEIRNLKNSSMCLFTIVIMVVGYIMCRLFSSVDDGSTMLILP